MEKQQKYPSVGTVPKYNSKNRRNERKNIKYNTIGIVPK
jgi:hypothetical protein